MTRLPKDDLAAVWRALANPVRRGVLDLLRDGPRTTGELAIWFPRLSRFAVMQHLAVLERAGLVTARRRGRHRFNFLNPVPLQRMYHRWVRQYQQPWAEALVSLKGELEAEAHPARKGSA